MARVALHVAAVGAVVLFLVLGAWQLSRHAERQAYNELVAERAVLPPEPVAALLGLGDDAAAYRAAVATGVYRLDDELLLTGRARDGQPGHHVLTPLEGPHGVLVVDRGWVPFALDTPPVEEAGPPTSRVTVTGVLLPGEPPAPLSRGGDDPALRLTRVDLDRIDAQVEGELAPLYLLLDDQSPAQAGALPVPAALPPLESGPHLAYAGQWFLFAVVVTVGYPLLLRQRSVEESGKM
jgi:surfeit locus 1 family protein